MAGTTVTGVRVAGWRPSLLPSSATPAARRIVAARALRGFADGLVSVLLATYLSDLGFSPLRIGAIVTGTLLGSAALTLAAGLSGHRFPARALLLAASCVMLATGTGFATITTFWPMLVVAVVGTLNPSAGDVSVFLPTEQAFLADQSDDLERPQLYAAHNLSGSFAGAFGALASGVPVALGRAFGWGTLTAERTGFVLYAVVAIVVATIYRGLPRTARPDHGTDAARRRGLGPSRRTVLELAALFSFDSAASGFVVQSLLVLWLHLRFGLSRATTAELFFAVGLLGAASQLAAGPLARRIGLVRAMVFTHLPANLLLVVAAFAPRAWIAIGLLLARALFSQMDVPARQAFVMAVVTPEERPAAASVTNVPRSLASAATPLLAGALLARSSFGWPLLIAGTGKVTYDLLLLGLFAKVPAEVGGSRRSPSPA